MDTISTQSHSEDTHLIVTERAQRIVPSGGVVAAFSLDRSGIPESRGYLRWINVAVGKVVKLIPAGDICYFRADFKYTLVATAASESLIHKPIKDLADELDPDLFWQIHRSTLVNVNAIADVLRNNGRMSVRFKQRPESLTVSQPYTHLFRQM